MSAEPRLRKGLFSTDFAIGLTIFLIVLSLALPLWDQVRAQTLATVEQREMQARALQVSDILLQSAGSPSDWNEATVQSIGLADEPHVLNASKVGAFFNLLNGRYDAAKSLLGIPAYELNFSVLDNTRSPFALEGNLTSFGRPASGILNVFVVTRMAVLQLNATIRKMVDLQVVVYR